MKRAITGYHEDEHGHWVAELSCGHGQHVRHEPPWMVREWATTEAGRSRMIGSELYCKRCEEGPGAGAPGDAGAGPASR